MKVVTSTSLAPPLGKICSLREYNDTAAIGAAFD